MNTINIGGRVIAVSPKEYDRILAKRRELESRGREISRELRQERVLPSEHRNATAKVTGSNWHPNDKVDVSEHAQWLASKNERLQEAFDLLKSQPAQARSLIRMHTAFSTIA